MVKTTAHTPKLKRKFYPLVSICTPTFNRRPFIPTIIQCVRNQTYPREKLEWIIVDDGTDPIEDVLKSEAADLSQMIKYVRVEKHMHLGEKRNHMHTFCKGSIIVYMDDDDYYPPERVEHAVEVLQENRDAMCAGASEIYIYFKHIHQMYQFGPYGPNHATAGTFAFRSELLKTSRYADDAALAEEKVFLKNYTVPFVQLDPLRTILVFSHNHNTFDKRKLLDNPNMTVTKISPKRVDDFIRQPFERGIREFFMERIDGLLANYSQGTPENKPDVLEQIQKIDAERKMLEEKAKREGQKIMLNRNGQEPIELSVEELVSMMNNQVNEINRVNELNQKLVSDNQTLNNNCARLREEQETLKQRLEQEVQQLREQNQNQKQRLQTDIKNQNQTKDVGFISVLVDKISQLEKDLEVSQKETASLKTEMIKLRIDKMKQEMIQEAEPAPSNNPATPINQAPSVNQTPSVNQAPSVKQLPSKSRPEVYVDINS